MTNLFTYETLVALQRDIDNRPIKTPNPMPGDPWLLASAMQKAVRRGETDRALSAAISLWYQDKTRFWRRLHIICVEDIGIGNVDAVIQTLSACYETRWRKDLGDLIVALHLARFLSESVKCRIAEELYTTAERSRCLQNLRLELSAAKGDVLEMIVLDDERPIVERILSLWYLAGTNRFRSDLIPQRMGSIDSALATIRSLPSPPNLTEACASVISRTPWPLALFTPLIWTYSQKKGETFTVEQKGISASLDVEGLPLYAADMFTRIGKASIREFQRSVPCLKFFDTQQIGLGVFYLDSFLVDKLLTNAELADIKQGGQLADMESSGLCLPEQIALKDCLRENWDIFTDIRQKHLRKYMKEREA